MLLQGMANNSNYTHVDLSFSYEYFSEKKGDDTVNLQQRISRWDLPKVMENFAKVTKRQFLSEPVKNFVR